MRIFLLLTAGLLILALPCRAQPRHSVVLRSVVLRKAPDAEVGLAAQPLRTSGFERVTFSFDSASHVRLDPLYSSRRDSVLIGTLGVIGGSVLTAFGLYLFVGMLRADYENAGLAQPLIVSFGIFGGAVAVGGGYVLYRSIRLLVGVRPERAEPEEPLRKGRHLEAKVGLSVRW